MLGHQTQDSTPGIFGRTWNSTREIYLLIWVIAAFAFVVLPIPMWLANAYAWDWFRFSLNGSLTLVGTFLIFFYGLRPTNVVGAGGISGLYAYLMDRDGSQGVATGPSVLYRATLWVGFSYFMLGITLTTWPMHEAPVMFWLAYLSIIGLAMVSQLMQWKGRWAPLIAGAYLLGCLGFAVWETTLSNNLDVATGEYWFDNDNGKALVVGYYSNGDFVVDPLGRTAAECIGDNKSCFYKGIQLVTPRVDDVPDTSGFGLNSVIDAVTKTPAEIAAEAAQAQAAIDAENARAAEIAAAREHARLAALEPDVESCIGREFSAFAICHRVTVKRGGAPFSITKTAAANAIMRDTRDGTRVEPNGLTFTYYHDNPDLHEATFHVFEIEPGQTYRTANIDYTHN